MVRRIDQILPSLGEWDAIGTDVRIFQKLIKNHGFLSEIFTDLGFDPRKNRHYSDYHVFGADAKNIVIHHFSIGSYIPYELSGIRAMTLTRFHNITPSYFFDPKQHHEAFVNCNFGRRQIPFVRNQSDAQISVSQYNAQEFDSDRVIPSFVLPVLRDYGDLAKKVPNFKLLTLLQKDEVRNVLFVGRILPHKAHHDLLYFLKEYRQHVDDRVRLILVGGYDPYYAKIVLPKLAQTLGLKINFDPQNHEDFLADVLVTGSVDEGSLASYYQASHLFMCLSDHEGFCVPLIEAMSFGLPVLACDSSAIKETAGNGAWIVDKHKPIDVLRLMQALLSEGTTRQDYITRSLKRAQDFEWSRLEMQFDSILSEIFQLQEERVIE